jgi:hypothetical protein
MGVAALVVVFDGRWTLFGVGSVGRRRIIIFQFCEKKKKKKKNRIYVKLHVLYVLGLFLYPCTLPTAPVSRSFGLRFSYESVIFDTD